MLNSKQVEAYAYLIIGIILVIIALVFLGDGVRELIIIKSLTPSVFKSLGIFVACGGFGIIFILLSLGVITPNISIKNQLIVAPKKDSKKKQN